MKSVGALATLGLLSVATLGIAVLLQSAGVVVWENFAAIGGVLFFSFIAIVVGISAGIFSAVRPYSFADYFIICTGANARNVQAIADEVALRLKQAGTLPLSMEGYNQAEWVLADYGDFLVHIFSPKSRAYYDLERLWRNARIVEVPPV